SSRDEMAKYRAVGLRPRPASWGKMNHIQWLRFEPSRSSWRAISRSFSCASTKRGSLYGSVTPVPWPWGSWRKRAAPALLIGREQPRQYIEEDHHWSGHQREGNQAQAHDGRVDA